MTFDWRCWRSSGGYRCDDNSPLAPPWNSACRRNDSSRRRQEAVTACPPGRVCALGVFKGVLGFGGSFGGFVRWGFFWGFVRLGGLLGGFRVFFKGLYIQKFPFLYVFWGV